MVGSYLFAVFGERKQNKYFSDNTVFGVSPYHYIWIVLPLFPYAVITAFTFSILGDLLLHHWDKIGHIDHLFRIVSTLMPILGLSCLSYISHRILTGRIIRIRSEWGRGILAFCILAIGPAIINSFQYLK